MAEASTSRIDTSADIYLCCLLPKSQVADAVCPDLKLLREQLQNGKLVIQPTQFSLQHTFIVPFFLIQSLHFQHPAFHDRRALAVALDKIVALFLIHCNLFFDCIIKFFCHFFTLLRIVNDIKAVDNQRRRSFVETTEERDKVLKNIHLVHMGTGNKIHVTIDAQFGGLKRPQVIEADRFNLLAVGTALIEFKKFFCTPAARRHIHRSVIDHVVAAEDAICLVIADICQLFVLIRLSIQCLLYQFTGENTGGVFIIPAVGKVDVRLAILRNRDALPDITRGRAEGI